jgi:hypothetical protein
VITTLDRTWAPAINTIGLSDELRRRASTSASLNLGGGKIDTGTPNEPGADEPGP